MFDVVCATGMAGVIPICVANKLNFDDIEALVFKLASVLKKNDVLQKLIGNASLLL
jgi:hypothetical protein